MQQQPQHQLGLGFDLPDAANLAPKGGSVSRPRGRSKPSTVSTASTGSTSGPVSPPVVQTSPAAFEALACQLDAHPDYRVLRRLVPTLDFGPAPGETEPVDLRHLLVLDTETTGLDPDTDKVIELALLRVTVDVRSGRPVGAVDVYDGLEDPGVPVPAQITEITGITTDMVRGHRLDEARVAAMLQGVDLVVAHNAGFDRPFVEARLPAFARLAWVCSLVDIDWKAMGHGSAKLENLAAAGGWFYDAHRAETDCHALLAVLGQPVARAGAAPDGASGSTLLSVLLEAAGQTHHRLHATGAPFEAKDALKARGYRWDGNQRVWATVLRSERALTAELAWLADAVYVGRTTRVRVESQDAGQRYSRRPGNPQMRMVERAWPEG